MAEAPRKKSPRAPSLSLSEALDRALKVYEKERLHPAPTDVVAQGMGYKSANNGSALSALASMRYYGVLERPKEGFLAVSKDVESYRFAPDESMRRALLVSFLRRPVLYGELLDRFESGLPSDANLRFELIQRGFSPLAAESALNAFKQSVDFVDYYGNIQEPTTQGINSSNVPDELIERESSPTNDGIEPPSKKALFSDIGSSVDDGAELDRIPVRLPGGRKAWLLIPTPFLEADKLRLKAQIDLLLTQEEELSPPRADT